MAIAIDNSWTIIQSAATTSFTQGSQTLAAAAAQFICSNSASAVTSMTNSQSDPFTLLTCPVDGSGNIITIGYCLSVTGGVGSGITVNQTSSTTITTGAISFTGLSSTNAFDRSVSTQSNPTGGNIPSGTTPTTLQANELLLSVAVEGGASNYTFTKDAAFTVASGMNVGAGSSGRTMIVEYQIVAATGAYSATVTSTNTLSNGNHFLVTFADTGISQNTASLAWVL